MSGDQHPAGAWLESAGARRPVIGNCSIGRAPTNALVLEEPGVSRRHAIIHFQDNREYWLVDLGSRNGTYWNGRRVSQPTRLKDQDRITIGETVLSFHVASPVEATIGGFADVTAIEVRRARRWLLLADVVGSTVLSQKLAPDDLSMLMGQWLSDSKTIIDANHGAINKFLGDGYFAYWPGEVAPETIAQTLRELRARQRTSAVTFRIVVHFGELVMGGASLGEESLMGSAVNRIFRMEKLAGSLGEARLMSGDAFALLSGHLTATKLGEHELAGFEGKDAFYSFLGDCET